MEEESKISIGAFQKCYQSKEYHELIALRDRMTMLDIFKKSRSETIHSAMIAWCFENKEFQNIPEPSILFLLRLAASNAERQKDESPGDGRKRFLDGELWWSISANKIKTAQVLDVKLEEKTNGGRSDIAIKCNVSDGVKSYKIRVVIENKVDSKEHDEQCENYEKHYSKQKEQDEFDNIYLFLAPREPKDKLSSNKFIKITYQELLDAVLLPMMCYKSFYSERTINYLEEYINTITSIRTNNILAMSNDTSSLLKDFFENNKDLIRAAVYSVAGENEELKEAFDTIDNGTITYHIKFPEPNLPEEDISGHTKMAYRIAQYLAKKYPSSLLLTKYGTVNNTICSDKNFILGRQIYTSKMRKLFTGNAIQCIDHNNIFCSNQWIPDKVSNLKEMLLLNDDIVIQ